MNFAANIAIVDDLVSDRNQLTSMIQEYANQRGLSWQISCFSDGESFLESLSSNRYTIVFLDILMPGINGIETARRMRSIDPEVLLVFITTEAGYAIEGYEVEASGFLIKEERQEKRRFALLMERMERKMQQETPLELVENNSFLYVTIQDIVYAEILNHNMLLHTIDGTHTLRITMEELRATLPQNGQFFECHRGILINLDAVKSLSGPTVLMTDGNTLPVSRRRQQELLQAYAVRSIARFREEQR